MSSLGLSSSPPFLGEGPLREAGRQPCWVFPPPTPSLVSNVFFLQQTSAPLSYYEKRPLASFSKCTWSLLCASNMGDKGAISIRQALVLRQGVLCSRGGDTAMSRINTQMS